MYLYMTETQRTFLTFLIFGLLNNILYVVILSAAVDLVGASTPKAIVLLADIIPSLTIKILAPFFIHTLPYSLRLWTLVALSSIGMVIVSLTEQDARGMKIVGITMASLSSGLGEISFLQLTHYYPEKHSIGGFSMGTGGAGLLGSFLVLLLTNIMGIPTWLALLSFSVAPFGFIVAFYLIMPNPSSEFNYSKITPNDLEQPYRNSTEQRIDDDFSISNSLDFEFTSFKKQDHILDHIGKTFAKMKPLFKPYMLPLCTVYVAEYVINQGISPTLLFPLQDLPLWLFRSYRDIYVVYGFLYQLGVFISRSSITFGVRIRRLYLLTFLQLLNMGITLTQSLHNFPFSSVWLLLVLIFFEGLLGGLLYANTFMSVSEETPKELREFSMGCVGISDSFGVMLAGCINWWLEPRLCEHQVVNGRDWCRTGSS